MRRSALAVTAALRLTVVIVAAGIQAGRRVYVVVDARQTGALQPDGCIRAKATLSWATLRIC
jgi:hypothetical protein